VEIADILADFSHIIAVILEIHDLGLEIDNLFERIA
jgi:hypothetical protein